MLGWLRPKRRPSPSGKIACHDCGALILPATARDTGGYCLPCAKLGSDLRAERAAFNAAVVDGSALRPLPSELDEEISPAALIDTSQPWPMQDRPEPPEGCTTAKDCLAALEKAENGLLYLGHEGGHHLMLDFNSQFGAITISNGFENETPLYAYALSDANLTTQVPSEMQIWSGCPCCGDGMISHASRAHMPRATAFAIFSAAISHDYSAARWPTYHLSSFTRAGHG